MIVTGSARANLRFVYLLATTKVRHGNTENVRKIKMKIATPCVYRSPKRVLNMQSKTTYAHNKHFC